MPIKALNRHCYQRNLRPSSPPHGPYKELEQPLSTTPRPSIKKKKRNKNKQPRHPSTLENPTKRKTSRTNKLSKETTMPKNVYKIFFWTHGYKPRFSYFYLDSWGKEVRFGLKKEKAFGKDIFRSKNPLEEGGQRQRTVFDAAEWFLTTRLEREGLRGVRKLKKQEQKSEKKNQKSLI